MALYVRTSRLSENSAKDVARSGTPDVNSGPVPGIPGRLATLDVTESFSLEVQAEKTDSGFPKTFYGGYIFVLVEYLCNSSPKMKIKHFKNYIFDFSYIVNYRNWLNASPTLSLIVFWVNFYRGSIVAPLDK